MAQYKTTASEKIRMLPLIIKGFMPVTDTHAPDSVINFVFFHKGAISMQMVFMADFEIPTAKAERKPYSLVFVFIMPLELF